MVLLAIAGAYHNSLLSLVRNLAADTPLAYLGLVPVIALGLVLFKARSRRWEPDVHDRYIDYIVGLPLVLFALAVVLVGPVLLSSFYWRWRLDMLTLPVFTAGAVTLAFGLRTTSRLKLPVAFLFLAWPLPYTLLLGDWVRSFSDATIAALRQIVAVVPVARAVDGGDGSLFAVQNPLKPFSVSVGSACAGVNGSLGFLLVGSAFAGFVRGRLVARLAWLVGGLALVWALNVVRILAIFGAGNALGEDFAINALHPFVGLLTFNVGIVAMIVALPLFRLRLRAPNGVDRDDGDERVARRFVPRLVVERRLVAMAVVVATATLLGSANAEREHELLTQDLGQPRLTEFSAATATVAGWTPSLSNSYPWVRQYFGDGSKWNRYTYLPNTAPAGDVGAVAPVYVTVDVISTWDLGALAAYGLEACYGFHNYRVLETQRVNLGAGVAGKAIVYYNPATGMNWTAVYWEWPVEMGGREEYERVVLNASSAGAVTVPAVAQPRDPVGELQFALASLLGGPTGKVTDPQLVATRNLLLGFGQAIVDARAQSALASAE